MTTIQRVELHGAGAPAEVPGSVRVLVVGADDWAVAQAVRVLTAAGLETLTCHDVGAVVVPCNALVNGRTCPVDAGIDLVVCIRSWSSPQPSPSEFGIVCSLRAGLPLVLAGVAVDHPLEAWADRVVEPDGDLVSACLTLMKGRMP